MYIKLKPVKGILVLLLTLSFSFSSVYASDYNLEIENTTNTQPEVIKQPILENLDLSTLKDEIQKSNNEKGNSIEAFFSSVEDNTVSTSVYTPFINYLDQQFSNMPKTPLNENVSSVFSKIKSNNPSIDYSSNYAIESQYVLSTTINGVRQDFYVMEIVYPVQFYPGSPILEDHGLIIYNQNYKSHPLYNTGRYKKGFSGIQYGNSSAQHYYLSIRAGTINAYVPIITSRYSEFGDFRKLYVFDFFNPSINIEQECGYDRNGAYPYFISWLTCGNRIILGRANWYSDGSGSNELYRIDRILGTQISNNNILFKTNSEFESGTALTYDTYTFNSTIGSTKTYLLDLNTLQTN